MAAMDCLTYTQATSGRLDRLAKARRKEFLKSGFSISVCHAALPARSSTDEPVAPSARAPTARARVVSRKRGSGTSSVGAEGSAEEVEEEEEGEEERHAVGMGGVGSVECEMCRMGAYGGRDGLAGGCRSRSGQKEVCCCNMLQCVAVCCCVLLQYVAVCCSVLLWLAKNTPHTSSTALFSCASPSVGWWVYFERTPMCVCACVCVCVCVCAMGCIRSS